MEGLLAGTSGVTRAMDAVPGAAAGDQASPTCQPPPVVSTGHPLSPQNPQFTQSWGWAVWKRGVFMIQNWRAGSFGPAISGHATPNPHLMASNHVGKAIRQDTEAVPKRNWAQGIFSSAPFLQLLTLRGRPDSRTGPCGPHAPGSECRLCVFHQPTGSREHPPLSGPRPSPPPQLSARLSLPPQATRA